MSFRANGFLLAAAILWICVNLTGCSPSVRQGQTHAETGVSGTVQGGQQPVSGALIQLYAVGTSGDQSPATPLIAATVTTSDGTGAMNSNANAGNANNSLAAGSFNITGDYTCPSPTAQVYLVATGGNPGLAPSITNPQIALMAALGECGNLSASTNVVVNELTTVASLAPLYSFISSTSTLGYGPGDASQFLADVAEVPEYTDVATGSVPGPALPNGYYASSVEIQTLGDILAICVNSGGASRGIRACAGNSSRQ